MLCTCEMCWHAAQCTARSRCPTASHNTANVRTARTPALHSSSALCTQRAYTVLNSAVLSAVLISAILLAVPPAVL